MPPEDLGRFGLMVTTVTLGLYVLGFELHAVVGRELALAGPERSVQLIRDQFVLYGAAYLLLLPMFQLIFWFGLLPTSLMHWFYPLLICEHLATELQRNLVFMRRPLLSNCLLFLRNAAWALLVLPWLYFATPSLRAIWIAWLCGSLVAITVALFALRKLPWRSAFARPDPQWLRAALRIVPAFFALALLQRALFSIDRYALESFSGEAAVGVYTFYFSIANVLVLVTDSGVVQLLTPDILRALSHNDGARVRRLEGQLLRRGSGAIAATLLALAVAIVPLVSLIGKAVYRNTLATFWVLLLACALLATGNLARVILFARRADTKPVWSYALGTPLTLILHQQLVPRFSQLGAAWATLGGCLIVAVMNWYWVQRRQSLAP